MSYGQKIVTKFAGMKSVLLLTAAFFTLSSMTADRANFSGEWKLNALKSEITQFPVCIFAEEDHVLSETMKIAGHADFLTVEVASAFHDGTLVARQEKLTFDGKASEVTLVGTPREKSAARWSDDGETMTVKSVKRFDMNDGEETEIKITEVWKLINEGKSISVQVNLNSISGEHTMKLVYDKIN